MTAAVIQELLEARPFRPFKLWLVGGATHYIHHPAMAVVNLKGNCVGVAYGGVLGQIVSVDHIVEIVMDSNLLRPAGNP